MQPNDNIEHAKTGFTILEIIVAITISAILAVVLVQFFSGQAGRSYRPIQNLNRNLALQSAMDQIASDYRNLLLTADEPLKTLQENIAGGKYWDSKKNNIQVKVNHCIEFIEDQDNLGHWSEHKTNETCVHTTEINTDSDDTLLKVTLSLGDQALTGIFTR